MLHEIRILVDAVKSNAKEIKIEHLHNGIVELRVELGTKSFRGEGRTLSEAWEQILLSLIMTSALN